jgi:hypothetical protein
MRVYTRPWGYESLLSVGILSIRMELHKDHACVCIGCVCLLLMIMMIESLWNCCTRPNAARGTVLTRPRELAEFEEFEEFEPHNQRLRNCLNELTDQLTDELTDQPTDELTDELTD